MLLFLAPTPPQTSLTSSSLFWNSFSGHPLLSPLYFFICGLSLGLSLLSFNRDHPASLTSAPSFRPAVRSCNIWRIGYSVCPQICLALQTFLLYDRRWHHPPIFWARNATVTLPPPTLHIWPITVSWICHLPPLAVSVHWNW